MGGVDRIDKTKAKASIRMRRSSGRYHCTIWWWAVGTFGHDNFTDLFRALVGVVVFLDMQKRWNKKALDFLAPPMGAWY